MSTDWIHRNSVHFMFHLLLEWGGTRASACTTKRDDFLTFPDYLMVPVLQLYRPWLNFSNWISTMARSPLIFWFYRNVFWVTGGCLGFQKYALLRPRPDRLQSNASESFRGKGGKIGLPRPVAHGYVTHKILNKFESEIQWGWLFLKCIQIKYFEPFSG